MAARRSRSERMQSLAAMADTRAKDLAARMQKQAIVLSEGESRLEELREYLASYTATRAADSVAPAVSAMRLAETRLFLERLRQAVVAQQESVTLARSRHESLRAQWIAVHLRTTVLGKAATHFQLDEAQDLSRQEQRTQDEMAARHHERKKKARDVL